MEARTVSALLFDGGGLVLDAGKNTLDVGFREAVHASRRKAWKAPPNPYQSGALRNYADQVGPAQKAAATHRGGAKKVVCYAEI